MGGGRMGTLPMALALLAGLAGVPAAHADDAVELLDKTRLIGQLVHYYEGMLTLRLPNGTLVHLPREKVARIAFQLPKPRAELATPEKAFARLRAAGLKGDLDTYIDAHSAYYQMLLGQQVAQATPEKFRAQLKQEWSNVQLEIVGTEIKGDSAVLKIRRSGGSQADEGELRFLKENSEWKMILPL
ncbi:MAG: hypothetical protein IPG96_17295 [Proteobacteria bacterium]|nr:hypothetical protein [Pseudomonadota bacterium]